MRVQGLVAMIMVRALYKDFSRYNRVATDEEKAEDKEETGWKLVHADVFRAPTSAPLLFAVLTGVGTQVCGVCLGQQTRGGGGVRGVAGRVPLWLGGACVWASACVFTGVLCAPPVCR